MAEQRVGEWRGGEMMVMRQGGGARRSEKQIPFISLCILQSLRVILFSGSIDRGLGHRTWVVFKEVNYLLDLLDSRRIYDTHRVTVSQKMMRPTETPSPALHLPRRKCT